MSGGLCNCFLLRRQSTPQRSMTRTKDTCTQSREALMSQDLVYQEISVSSLPEQPNLDQVANSKTDAFISNFSAFHTSRLVSDDQGMPKPLPAEKSGERRNNKTLAREMKTRLSLLLQRIDTSSDQTNSLEEEEEHVNRIMTRPSLEEVLEWSRSLDALLTHGHGLSAFRNFLQTEFSEENIEFWVACEDFKKTKMSAKIAPKAHNIFTEFIGIQAPKEINLDSHTREQIIADLKSPTLSCFDVAQKRIYSLMEKDSYPRFLKSQMYLDLAQQTH
ncbi:regulator of G-protein signaling 8-like [Protopterus annectens]|uniref:regulator of G-protein signaling 8-like n=1 Tax=Protopterus annectens TaxID=7888 RepID=UPI001CF9975F|nr:regulator of G-protein signaling 8-like [Protopterus annectens]